MASKKVKVLKAATGTYQLNGEEKTRWVTIGSVFKNDETKKTSMKIDALPCGNEWDGWVQMFEPEEPKPREDF
jgi:hypothetical protein